MHRPDGPQAHVPDAAPAVELIGTLARHGIACALGGSALLESLGLGTRVNDWDITTDASLEDVCRAVEGRSFESFGSSGVHADAKLVFAEGPMDLIVRFALRGDEGVVRIPTIVTGTWRGMPVGSPAGWAIAYALMGRMEKCERLFEHLARIGADRASVDYLLAQPLPRAIAARLGAIPRI